MKLAGQRQSNNIIDRRFLRQFDLIYSFQVPVNPDYFNLSPYFNRLLDWLIQSTNINSVYINIDTYLTTSFWFFTSYRIAVQVSIVGDSRYGEQTYRNQVLNGLQWLIGKISF